MIQRMYMGEGARGRRMSGQSAAVSAWQPMCGGHPVLELSVGLRGEILVEALERFRISGKWQLNTKVKQVREQNVQVDESTPIGARTGRAALGDPGG